MSATAKILASTLAVLVTACGENYGQPPADPEGDISQSQTTPSNPNSGPDAAISPSNSDAPDPLAEPNQTPPPATGTP